MKKIECPLCDEKFNKLAGMYEHIEEDHQDNIPEGYDVQRYLYYIKTGKTHGSCVVCKKDTGWNESTGKYKRFCDNPKCKESYRETFKKRMIGKYGKTTLLNDPEQQRKMLAHRHISGEYEWTDGTKKTYTGSYELDFLKMLDVFMNFDSDDVMSPSPHTYYYEYEGEKKFYIPDVFIPSLNLEIEIKDGGDNPNMHGKIVAVDKVKEKIKDNVMASQKDYGYIKIVNKNYDEFFKYLLDQKEKTAGAKNINFGNIIRESMLSVGNSDDIDIALLTEAVTYDGKDMYYNFDKFESGENNTLLVTGLSGSGKSTIAKKLASKYNAEYIELDKLDPNTGVTNKSLESVKANSNVHRFIYDFLESHPSIHNKLMNENITNTDIAYINDDFLKYCVGRAKKESKKKFIIEGIQIYDYMSYYKKGFTCPIIIMGTSSIKSYVQAAQREKWSLMDIIKKAPEKIGARRQADKQLRDIKRSLKDGNIALEGAHDYKAMCMNAPVESSPEINDLLTHTINNGHHIWLSTDWHLWRFDKDNKCIVKNPNFDAIISCHYADVVNKNDVFIYLGDLVDDEFADKDALRDAISNLKGIKILVKGNNDIFDDDFYKSCGFTYVTYKFMWEGILFSHMPIENEYRLNCHGHLHGKMEYWINYTNQVDVYTADNRPVDIFEVIKARHEYAKNITITVRENAVQEASTGRKRVNDKGEDIPEKCPKCGSKIGLYLKGEPVWVCSNDKCKAYYGTAPCNESLETILEASAGKLRDVDNYYDFERFVNGDTNILFITGLTGGNKTQIARDISSSFNSEYINLDIFSETNINNIIDGAYVGSGSKEYITAIREFADKKLAPNHEDPTKIEPLTKNQIIEFIKTLIKGLSPNKRYVIEGIYIYRYYDDIKDIIDKYPVIVSRQNFAETVKLLSKSTITNMSNIFNIIYDESEDSVDWINNEKKSLDTFVENIRADREDMPDAIYKQTHYPVYVCLMHSGTVLANAIQKVTGDEFSHASISFDPSLRAMYSFAKDRNDMSLKPGLIHEDIQSAFLHKPIPYSLYVTFVPRAEFKQMKRKLYEISKNAANYKYSIVGLVKYALGMAAETKNQMFCSEFVSTILNARTNRTDGLRPAEVKPETFKNLSKFQLVQKGVLTDYDMKATIARVRTMKK